MCFSGWIQFSISDDPSVDMVGKGILDQRNKPSLACVHPELEWGGEKVWRIQVDLALPTPLFQPDPSSQRPTHSTSDYAGGGDTGS